MGRYSKLVKNTSIFFIANFGSKILSFLLVRFYTEFLSTEEYGIIDLLSTTASLAFPIVTLCITEAVLRFSIDDESNRGKILTDGLFVIITGNLIFVLTVPLFSRLEMFRENIAWLYLLTFSNALFAVIIHFARGIGKSKLFAASGLIHTVLQIGLNILFLVTFSWGIKGYLIASVLSNIVTSFTVFFAGKLYRYILKQLDCKYLRQMLVYAIPLIPNSIFWWIMQSSDRYVITYMLSSSDNGLYAVANKIPTLITTISGIFFQAWQISSVEEANSKHKNHFYSSVFNALSIVLNLATSALLVILQPLYRILTEETYYSGWTSTPFLLCAMVFSCYSSYLGTNYVAMKKTNGVFLTTLIGALLNIILNIILTPVIGIRGTALATMISFFITWISRIIGTRKFVKIDYPVKTFIFPTVLLIAQSALLSFGVNSIWIQMVSFVVILSLYMENLIGFAKFSVTKIKQLNLRKR